MLLSLYKSFVFVHFSCNLVWSKFRKWSTQDAKHHHKSFIKQTLVNIVWDTAGMGEASLMSKSPKLLIRSNNLCLAAEQPPLTTETKFQPRLCQSVQLPRPEIDQSVSPIPRHQWRAGLEEGCRGGTLTRANHDTTTTLGETMELTEGGQRDKAISEQVFGCGLFEVETLPTFWTNYKWMICTRECKRDLGRLDLESHMLLIWISGLFNYCNAVASPPPAGQINGLHWSAYL